MCVCVCFQSTVHLLNRTHMNSSSILVALPCGNVSCGCQTSALTTLHWDCVSTAASGAGAKRTRSAAAAVRMSSSLEATMTSPRAPVPPRFKNELCTSQLSAQWSSEIRMKCRLVLSCSFFSLVGCVFASVFSGMTPLGHGLNGVLSNSSCVNDLEHSRERVLPDGWVHSSAYFRSTSKYY